MRLCNVSDCNSKHWSRGYCIIHYGRWRRWGDPLKVTKERHGMADTPEYTSWESMIQRCHNPNSDGYYKYGAKGIKVCDRWRKSFKAFYEDMGKRPENMTLDRIDTFGDYEPSNCKWSTRSEQQTNRKPRSNTGVLGVCKVKGRYIAQITKDYKYYNLGTYATLEQAIEARETAKQKLWAQKS